MLLKAKGDRTGKLLAGSKVIIGSGDKTLLTLTTGSDGTATGKLPTNSRTGTDFWAQQVKAPAAYDIYKPAKEFKAKPGDPATVTTTNAKTATTPAPYGEADRQARPGQARQGRGHACAVRLGLPEQRQDSIDNRRSFPEGLEGCTNAAALTREIQQLGYRGDVNTVRRRERRSEHLALDVWLADVRPGRLRPPATPHPPVPLIKQPPPPNQRQSPEVEPEPLEVNEAR
ncbi:hypothetical protein ACFU76_18495 [Streptomyces sp. NPDC057539]|uniref:hypothetical protein n=1 Tax=Streptomyces sp. NPDC057539 TaxID=3346159 RepID=UPI0036CFAD01